MISSDRRLFEVAPAQGQAQQTVKQRRQRRRPLSGALLWLCLALACVGTSWFSYQCLLVPQPQSFAPDWQQAQWIQPADTSNPVAYFRLATSLNSLPDRAFVTLAAAQVFDLYVNGTYIGSNASDFVSGETPRTYMYDVSSAVQAGPNVIGIRVAHLDKQAPQVRANFGVLWGKITHFFGTNATWQATDQSALVYPRQPSGTTNDWAKPLFDDGLWLPAHVVASPPTSSPLLVNPLVYEQPMPLIWLSTGYHEESYFVRRFSLPAHIDQALLRLVATGDTQIFINGRLYIRWSPQLSVPQQIVSSTVNTANQPVQYQKGLLLGVYDVTPYLHAGENTLAFHVLSPGTSTSKVGLDLQKAALSTDMFLTCAGQSHTLLDTSTGWHASARPVAGWINESSAAFSWPAPVPVGRPGSDSLYYLPGSAASFNAQYLPSEQLLPVLLASSGLVLLAWLFMALVARRRYSYAWRTSLELAVLPFLPALVGEALLLTLAREPLITPPFPYTASYAALLLALFAASALLLWFHLYAKQRQQQAYDLSLFRQCYLSLSGKVEAIPAYARALARTGAALHSARGAQHTPASWRQRLRALLALHWPLVLLSILMLPLVCYDPTYEPFWQDELSSLQAAHGILAHGIPLFPSGVLYPKAELFSYLLALLLALFGSSHLVPRLLSPLEYIVSLPLLYAIGCSLFKKRSIAWLATAMLALSPYSLIWARQTRMYEQALLMVLVTMYMFYRALQQRERPWPVYQAVGCLLLAYFSHEESFIILPAVVVCVLLGSREGPLGIPTVLRQKHWWFAALLGSAVIGTQLLIVQMSHPVHLGTDQSVRPQIQLTTNNIPFYFHMLFSPKIVSDAAVPWSNMQPWLTVNSLLAAIGCLWAWGRRDGRARYCALFLLLSLCTLTFLFTMQADRYFYPLLPMYYLMGAYAVYQVLHALWLFAQPRLAACAPTRGPARKMPGLSRPIYLVSRATAALLCACVLLLPMLPLSNYDLFVSRTLGLSYHRHYPDYDNAGAYIRDHLQKGDVVITIAPAVSILYYVGQTDYYFSVDHAMFVFERDGALFETTSGAHPLLNEADFQAVLASHTRIWLVSDNGTYQAQVAKNARFTFPPPDFRLVYEGYGSAVYFRSKP